jgi:hypothetical protein
MCCIGATGYGRQMLQEAGATGATNNEGGRGTDDQEPEAPVIKRQRKQVLRLTQVIQEAEETGVTIGRGNRCYRRYVVCIHVCMYACICMYVVCMYVCMHVCI